LLSERNADPFIVRDFLVENLSVVLHSYFKYTKKRFGEGRRIFLMSLYIIIIKGYHESKIVTRFGLLRLCWPFINVTLKLR
jgi:phospho-N-acetylmuramoyl-pentapeptide-transferase